MLNRRNCYSHTFVCVATSLLLIFGCTDYVFAQGKAETQPTAGQIDPPVSSTTTPVAASAEKLKTAINEKPIEANATKTERNESQAEAVATTTGSNETHTKTNGTTGSNATHTQTQSSETHVQTNIPGAGNNDTHTQTRSSETPAQTDVANTGSNGTHTETQSNETHVRTDIPEAGKNATNRGTNATEPGNVESRTEMSGPKTGNNVTGTVSNSTQSSNTNQTAGTAADVAPSPAPVLSIFLINDLQYDIFPVNPANGNMCDDPGAEKCVGGLPSLKTLMDEIRANVSQSIWLNAGNTLGGDLFRALKFDAAVQGMQLLNFSAIAVGPNVFKYGGDGGRRYLDGLSQSIVVSNIDPPPQHKSVIFSVGNCNVSVTGYLENTEMDQDVQGVSIKNYTESVLEEVARIRKEQNVSNLISVVIGSSSVNKSKALVSNETIDFVFFSDANWSEEAAQRTVNQNAPHSFWEAVNKTSSKKTGYVGSVRANRSDVAGRFVVGRMDLPIANNCTVANAKFTVLYYNTTTPNETALDFIKSELERLQSQNKSLTLNTKNLTAERGLCNHSECSLGNLITDAMVAALNGNSSWSGNATRIGIFPAAHLQPNATIPEGNVTVTNLYGLIDEDAYIYSVLLTGRQLKDLLEFSINSSSNSNSTDFLHVSRLLQVEYRKDRDNTSEVVSVKTVSAVSSSMQLSELNVNDSATFYNVSIPFTLLKMDSYKKLLSAVNASFHSVTVVEAVTKYVNNTGSMSLPVLGSRFICLEPNPAPPPPPPIPCANHTGTTVAVTLVVAALVVGLIFGVWRWRSIRSHLLPGYVNF